MTSAIRTTGAIAHPYPEALAVLERMLPRLDGVRRVDIRTYVRTCQATGIRLQETEGGQQASGPDS